MGQSECSNRAVRFGVFEIDLRSGELRKQGVHLRLQEQPFKVLAALLEHPGEIVSREQLVQRLWADGTFVDFDRGLNAAVTRLRQVLADSAESPRYIETVARRGYRLLVPVQEILEHGAPPPSAARPPSVKRKWPVAAYAILVLACVVVSLALLRTPEEPKLEQITRDPGLATDPALSPDGKLLAYASDRGSQNLNLWVRQLNGEGRAVQLTHAASDAYEPSFSPDGSRIVYRSEQEGGGIYTIPAIGGESALLIANGRNPRFSPDGKWIAYSRGRPFGEIFVIPASGGGSRRVGADLPPAGYPVWSPDSRQLLVYASPRSGMSLADADWWTVTVESGAARRTSSFARLRSQGLPLQFATDVPQASVWIDDTVIFSASKGDSRSIWRVPFKSSGSIAGRAERLTLGTSLDVTPSSIAQGSVVYASLKRSMAVWSLPIQPNVAKVTGELHRVTDGETLEADPSLSADGRLLAYGSTVLNHEDIWLKDLQTGKEVALAATPAAEWHPQISRDGSRIAYTIQDRAAQGIYVVPTTGGAPLQVAPEAGWVFDWTPDNRYLLYHAKEGNHPDLQCLDLQSRAISSCLGKPGAYIFQSKVAPGGRWLAFEAVFNDAGSDSRLFIVRAENGIPVPGADWILVSDEHGWSDKPRWSPDGNTLYFVSRRDGFLCVWAQRLDPAAKHPSGAPFPIYHFHSNRLSLNAVDGGLQEIDLAGDTVVMNLAEFTGNIWKLTRQ